jgi:hypothetical protein
MVERTGPPANAETAVQIEMDALRPMATARFLPGMHFSSQERGCDPTTLISFQNHFQGRRQIDG